MFGSCVASIFSRLHKRQDQPCQTFPKQTLRCFGSSVLGRHCPEPWRKEVKESLLLIPREIEGFDEQLAQIFRGNVSVCLLGSSYSLK